MKKQEVFDWQSRVPELSRDDEMLRTVHRLEDRIRELEVLASGFRKVLRTGLVALNTDLQGKTDPRMMIAACWVDLTVNEAHAIERVHAEAQREAIRDGKLIGYNEPTTH